MTHEPSHEPDHKEPSTPASNQRSQQDARLRADVLADRLETLLEQAPKCIETISKQLAKLDTMATSVAGTAQEPLEKIEAACSRAEDLVEKLSRATTRLTDEGDNAERKIELLINGLDAGDVLQNRLGECNEQLKLLVDESEKVASKQGGKLQNLMTTCDERMAVLNRKSGEVVDDTVEAIRNKVQTTVAESEKRLSEQQRQTTTVLDDLRTVQQSAERRFHGVEETLLKKVDETIASRLGDFEREIGKAVGTNLERVAGAVEAIRSKVQTTVAESEKQLSEQQRQTTAVLDDLRTVQQSAERRLHGVEETLLKKVDETIASRLGDFEREIGKAVGTNLERVAGAVEESQAVLKNLERADEAADQRVVQLSDHLGSAAGFEEKLTGVTETARSFLDTVDTRMSEASAAGTRAETLTAELETRCTQVTAKAEAAGQKVRQDAKSVLKFGEAAISRHQQALSGAIDEVSAAGVRAETLTAELETRCTQVTAKAEAVGQKIRQDAKSVLKFGEAAISRHQRALSGAIDEGKRASEELQTRVGDVTEKIEQLTSVARSADANCAKLEQLNSESEELAAGITQNHTNATSATQEHFDRIKQALTDLTQDTNDVVSRKQQALVEFVGEANTCSQALHETIDAAKQTSAQLSGKVQTGADLRAKLSQTSDRVTELLGSAKTRSDTLATLSIKAGRTAQTAEERIEKFDQEFTSAIKAGEASAIEQRTALNAVVEDTKAMTERLKNSVDTAEQSCGQLTSRTHAAVEAESALCHITAAAHEIRERIEHTSEPLNKRIAQAGELVESLQTACSQADGIQQKVRGLDEKISALVQEGETSLTLQHDVLFAAIAEAKERTDELRKGMTTATKYRDEIAEQYDQAGAIATEAANRVDALVKEVWSLTTGTEQRARDLALEVRRAGELLEELNPARVEAETLRQGITHQNDAGHELLEQLKVRIGSGNETSGRLQNAQANCVDVLDQLTKRNDETKEVAERVSTVAGELQQDHDAIITNKATLDELTERGEKLVNMVQQTQITVDALKVQINSLLAEPQTIVCNAKQQALQLTNVCRAVKKVFSGLSKASLGATEKIDQLNQLSKTLQQWVGETANLQKRLGGITQHTPVGDESPKWSQPATPAQRPKRDRMEAVGPAPSPKTAKQTPLAETGRRISPEVVAELIEDAKRHHKMGKQLVPSA